MSQSFEALAAKADAAGKAAAALAKPVPMVVGSPIDPFSGKGGLDPSKPVYFVADGVCGFAWIAFKGNSAWGKWAKKIGLAKPKYGGGLQIWISAYNQSMQLKEAYAQAYAKVLQEAGIDAYAGSAMD